MIGERSNVVEPADVGDVRAHSRRGDPLDVRRDDLHSLGDEALGKGPADAARRAGDDRDLPVELFHRGIVAEDSLNQRERRAMSERIEKLVAELTVDEKAALVAGIDLWHGPAVERLGIPPLKVTDGPSGARGEQWSGRPSANFPCGSALGATWNPELVHEVGTRLGIEAKRKQAHALLAPTVNIHRHPLAGRNFECFAEDPFLSARLAVAYITGVQSQGVGCTVKHFVANDSEFERMTISSELDERTLREISLVPFEAAVTEAGTWALMTAYNRVHGTYCSEHEPLLRMLREEWGFEGVVMSDWYGTHSTVAAANAGLDLEMPGPPQWFGTPLAEAVRAGQVPEVTLDAKARRVLT
ncbi:MAG TPA: glycoside hydrolase family 3 N-terminal domain-containing protein, partial [Acidimicrobiia bacterium]|nr:glycoside hydrolase family 3 N-terminal domain-containing protein [Acidimicrobiia bacterium]